MEAKEICRNGFIRGYLTTSEARSLSDEDLVSFYEEIERIRAKKEFEQDNKNVVRWLHQTMTSFNQQGTQPGNLISLRGYLKLIYAATKLFLKEASNCNVEDPFTNECNAKYKTLSDMWNKNITRFIGKKEVTLLLSSPKESSDSSFKFNITIREDSLLKEIFGKDYELSICGDLGENIQANHAVSYIFVQNERINVSDPYLYDRLLDEIMIDSSSLFNYEELKNLVPCPNRRATDKENGDFWTLEDKLKASAESRRLCDGFRRFSDIISKKYIGDGNNLINLYDFIISYIEEYDSFKEEYERLGRLDLGKVTGINFREYVDDHNGYRLLTFDLSYDYSKSYCTMPVNSPVRLQVPVDRSKECRFMISERDGQVFACFTQEQNINKPIPVNNIPSEVLREYLDLFGKYRRLFELARDGIETENIFVKINPCKSLVNGLESIDLRVNGVVDFNDEHYGRYSIATQVRPTGSGVYSHPIARFNDHLVNDFLPSQAIADVLKSIVVNRGYLNEYGINPTTSEIRKKYSILKEDK